MLMTIQNTIGAMNLGKVYSLLWNTTSPRYNDIGLPSFSPSTHHIVDRLCPYQNFSYSTVHSAEVVWGCSKNRIHVSLFTSQMTTFV